MPYTPNAINGKVWTDEPSTDLFNCSMTGHYPFSMPVHCKSCLIKVVLSVWFCILLQACATPADHLNFLASEQGYTRSKIVAAGYDLLVYQNQLEPSSGQGDSTDVANQASAILHVYLEGDGSPWAYRTIVMPDPTPRSPMMLTLMALDSQRASYLGRPCYNGSSQDPDCDATLWTSGRYSTRVVASMASGIRVLARRHKANDIRLFGHSGGGALAMLLAAEVPEVTHVVTIAGNLNTDAWIRHHGYSPLYSSMNPALQAPLRSDVGQWHLIGGRDAVIPPTLVRPFIMSQQAASGYLMNGYTHGCCWHNIWPSVLEALADDTPESLPGERFKAAER